MRYLGKKTRRLDHNLATQVEKRKKKGPWSLEKKLMAFHFSEIAGFFVFLACMFKLFCVCFAFEHSQHFCELDFKSVEVIATI